MEQKGDGFMTEKELGQSVVNNRNFLPESL
jgi:hypothetical protein